MDPVILFFLLGLTAGVLHVDIKLPAALYESLSLFLLVTIGLKGGLELAQQSVSMVAVPVLVVVAIGVTQTLVGYAGLRWGIRLKNADAAAVAAHYGSVSVGTYAVVSSYLAARAISFEAHMPVFVVALEIPAIVVGVLLARGLRLDRSNLGQFARELFLGKGVVLLVGGLLIGWLSGPAKFAPYQGFFFGGFKGVLALFLLEMGLVCANRLADLKSSGFSLMLFALAMPILGAGIGAVVGPLLGLSLGGTVVLATLFASASYIAVPAAFRMMVPEASPSLSLGAALGITFPFNVMLGIPLYLKICQLTCGASP